jgi:hypothetical protein
METRRTGYVRCEVHVIHVTRDAREALRPGEALVFDWHRVAICCAVAGEVSLRRTSIAEVERSGSFVGLRSAVDAPVFAHRRAYAQLADRRLTIDCRRRFGRRWFTSDLPADFGLRAAFGRVPGKRHEGEGTA